MATRRRPLPAAVVEAVPFDVRAMNAVASLLFAGVALLGAGAVANRLMRLPEFTLHAIEVGGDVARNSATTIRANVAPRLQGNFFSLDLGRAQAAFQGVPWVRRAVVQRIWPDRLAVRLEEHRAAAWWHTEQGDDKLVNLQGEVFEANPGDVEDEELPTLQGPEGSAAALLAMQRRLAPVFAAIGERVESLGLSARGSWRVTLEGGATVELGRGTEEEVLARTQAFTGTVTQLTARYQRALEHADLRHSGGYALRLQGIGTVEAGASAAKK
jgi:cell division protein FtsQ